MARPIEVWPFGSFVACHRIKFVNLLRLGAARFVLDDARSLLSHDVGLLDGGRSLKSEVRGLESNERTFKCHALFLQDDVRSLQDDAQS